MKSKKLLSLLLAVIMIMSAVPMFASAAEPITLTVANIAEWPTAEGEMYVGQIYGEHITFVGGKVIYDGVEVPGKFEHFSPTMVASLSTADLKANLKFVPDDTATYKGFNILLTTNVIITVKKATAVLLDENNPPVATAIKEGQTLADSKITGGTMKNPYNDKLNISSRVWTWVDPTQVITESGEYLAKWEGDTRAYETVTDYIYVEVEKDQKATTLKTMPVVNFVYNPNLTWGDYEFVDASAVVYGTDTEVPGTFSVVETLKNSVPRAGSYDISLIFTPNDTENYIGFSSSITVNVNPCPISFGEDHKGTSIDEPFVYEVDADTLMRDVLSSLKGGILNYPPQSVIGIEDANKTAENGRIYKVTVIHDNPNYVGSEVYLSIAVKEVEFAALSASYAASTEEIRVNFNSNKAPGTFDVYLDGKLIGDDVKLANDHIYIPYKLATSGKHTVKVVYNPIENDYYFMADYETEIQANVERHITLKNMDVAQKVSVNGKEDYPSSAYILYGDEISIKYGFEDLFVSWVITDTAGKAVDLGVDLTSSEISFTMPDHDLVIAVKTTLDEEAPDDGAGSDDDTDNGIFGGICSFLQKIISWFINIIKQMMSFLGLGA